MEPYCRRLYTPPGAPDAPGALHADAPQRPVGHAAAGWPPPGRALEQALQHAAVRDQQQRGARVRRCQPLHLCINCCLFIPGMTNLQLARARRDTCWSHELIWQWV